MMPVIRPLPHTPLTNAEIDALGAPAARLLRVFRLKRASLWRLASRRTQPSD